MNTETSAESKPAKDRVFFIYLDWTMEEVPRVFYVGKGNEGRVKTADRNKYWKSIAKKYGRRRELILTTSDESFAFEMEIHYIREMKTFAADWADGSGWGANFTRGGEGQSGRSPTEEERRTRSIASTGRMHTEETKKKISASNMGKKLTPEHCALISKNNRERVVSEETRKKMSASRSGPLNHQFGKKGELSPNFGKTGEQNAQFGRCGELSATFGRVRPIKEVVKFSGENAPTAKLTLQDVRQIREMIPTGKSDAKIADLFGVKRRAICDIRLGKTWKHFA